MGKRLPTSLCGIVVPNLTSGESVGWRDAEALQFVKQRSTLQTQESGGATSSTDLPVRFPARCQDLAPDLVLEAFAAGFRFSLWNDLGRTEIEGSAASQNDAPRNEVLQFTHIARPRVA
jgi:hypothetical protein